MNLIMTYIKNHPIETIEQAYQITRMICDRVMPPSYVSLEDSPCALQEIETWTYFNLPNGSWLPAPEILLTPFLCIDIQAGESCWSLEHQVYWLPEDKGASAVF